MQNQTALLSFFYFFFIFLFFYLSRCGRIQNSTETVALHENTEHDCGGEAERTDRFRTEFICRGVLAASTCRCYWSAAGWIRVGGEGRALRRDSVAVAVAVAVAAAAVRVGLLAWFTGVILQLQIELRLSRWVFSNLLSLRDLTKPKCQKRGSAWEGAKGRGGAGLSAVR